MGNPIFGLSNIEGNPTLQGIYGFGSYDEKYPKALSLDYIVPSNDFSGVEIGCILAKGSDLKISYKSNTVTGAIAQIDYLNKFEGAYIETMNLIGNEDLSSNSIIEGICANYISIPDDTDIEISVRTRYG